jgi:hypothetical protein
MNKANVAALKAILVELLEPGNLSADEVGDLAEDLGASGVLVPKALTGSDTKTAVHAALDYDVGMAGGVLPAVKGEKLIAALERIAKGEA